MRGAQSYGPSLVVLAAAGVALLAGPFAVKQFVNAQTTVDVVQASNRLAQPGNILEQINGIQRDIAKVVEPSVVHVSTVGTIRRRAVNQAYISSGSGWIFDDAGHIVTNAHVVDGADRIQVQLHDGTMHDAELVGRDLRTDIAVVKIDASGVHPAQRGDSDQLQQGDMVYAFGSPFDFRFSMSSGIVSGLGRSAGLSEIDYQNFIQVDAAINPGNSGGPLTDIYGHVIGMNTAIATGRGNTVGQGQFAGIGLAIPMTMIESAVGQIISTGEVKKGYLGVSVNTPDFVAALNAEEFRPVVENFKGEGAVVTTLERGSPAEQAGLRIGDVILSIDGKKTAGGDQVRALISSKRPGTEVVLDIWRLESGKTPESKAIKVSLAELDPGKSTPVFTQTLNRLGFARLSTATERRAAELNVPFRRGVLVEEVREGSRAAEVIPVGSVIVEVLGQAVTTEDELFARVARFYQASRSGGNMPIPIVFVTPDGQEHEDTIPQVANFRD